MNQSHNFAKFLKFCSVSRIGKSGGAIRLNNNNDSNILIKKCYCTVSTFVDKKKIRFFCSQQKQRQLQQKRYFGNRPIPVQESFAVLPPEIQDTSSSFKAIQSIWNENPNSKLVVIDDDPTGTQTVQNVPVLADWSVEALVNELEEDKHHDCFYILSNSRALSAKGSKDRLTEICRNLQKAQKITKKKIAILSRSDSTLRGHFPLEVQVIEKETHIDNKVDGWILTPYFQAGGRITMNDVHYIRTGNDMIPCGLSEFAKDKAFGYKSSNLKDWIKEKMPDNNFAANSVKSITLDDIRRGGSKVVAEKLKRLKNSQICIANMVNQQDLDIFMHGLLIAEKDGSTLLYRTGADFVATRIGIRTKAPLPADFFHQNKGVDSGVGGLIVVGSYVPKTSSQLSNLIESLPTLVKIEFSVSKILASEESRRSEIQRVCNEVNESIAQGKDVVLYTSREIIQDDPNFGLEIGEYITNGLVSIVKSLEQRPRYLIAKGGITSNDVAVHGLGMKRAIVNGQILPGVPVWSCGDESKFPNMKYIVFPGNVGDTEALTTSVMKLRNPTATVEPAIRPSKLNLRGSKIKSKTLEILYEARNKKAAVGAFNIYNMEGIKAVVDAAQALSCPAILQIHPTSLKFGGSELLQMCKAYSNSSTIPIAVHLDHSSNENHIRMALENGIDSVMCDGSHFDYNENIEWTRKMTQLAHSYGIPVEGELGKLAGEEDGLSIPEKEAKMTDPYKAVHFVDETCVDMLAVTVGNVHGKYSNPNPELDFERLQSIYERIAIPLVLHGASGLSVNTIHRAMDMGVCKFNVNTEIRNAYLQSMQRSVKESSDLLPTMIAGYEEMKKKVEEKMEAFTP